MIKDAFERSKKKLGVSLGALGTIKPSKKEIEDETIAVSSMTATDDEILDEEIAGVKSSLKFESETIHESESDSILSARERQTLKKDMESRVIPQVARLERVA